MFTLPRAWSPAGVATLALVPSVLIALGAPGVRAVAVTLAITAAAIAAAVDVGSRRLPDTAVAAVATAAAIAGVADGSMPGVAAGAAILSIPLLITHLVAPSAMGFGDVKFAAALGAVVGLFEPASALVALCVASGVTATVGLVRRRGELPFGPGLVLGTVIALVAHSSTGSEGAPW